MTASGHMHAAPRAASRGFILISVIWILGALAVFVSVYALYVGNTASAAASREEAFTARSLATAAVELVAFRLLSQPGGERQSRGEMRFRMGGARITAAFQDESARIDLNTAPRAMLAGLFTALGAQPAAAEQYARRIIGWRAPPAIDVPPEEEVTLYQDAGLGYRPRAAPFVHVDELWRVAGLPPALVQAALPHLTVFSGRSKVNLAEADPVVAAAAATARADKADPDDAPAGAAEAAGPSDAVRVSLRIDLASGRSRFAEAVILVRNFTETPYRVLSWRDDTVLPAMSTPIHTETRP